MSGKPKSLARAVECHALRRKISEFSVCGGKAWFDLDTLNITPRLPNGTYKLVMFVLKARDEADAVASPRET